MTRRKRRSDLQDAFDAIAGFRDLVNETFEKLTGKPIASWLKEFQRQGRELPPGEETASPQPDMPLADAYAIHGLPQTAPFEEVERRYRDLARLFHPDALGGYKEAMVLLNNAYDRIRRHRGSSP